MTPPQKARILAVEDNPDAQLLLNYLLSATFEVYIASAFEDALNKAKTESFDIFLLDINLGERRTGVDLLHHLRSLPTCANTPALALTAYALPGDRDRFIGEGFDRYLSKPFTRSDLIAAINQAMNGRAQKV